ncbi:homeodomain-like protein [Tanacetum coccineum]
MTYGTSRGRSTETSDGLAAIQAQLNNLGREIKKVNKKVYAAQVRCEQCKGPHYTKDCPQKEKGKTLDKAYYTLDVYKKKDLLMNGEENLFSKVVNLQVVLIKRVLIAKFERKIGTDLEARLMERLWFVK